MTSPIQKHTAAVVNTLRKHSAHLCSTSQTWREETIYIKALFKVFAHFSLQRRQLVYNETFQIPSDHWHSINLHYIWKFRFSGQEVTSKNFTEESMGIVYTIEDSTFDSFLFSISQLHWSIMGATVNLSLNDRSRELIFSPPTS